MTGVSVSLQPKNTGRVLRPPLMKPLTLGTAGMRMRTFCDSSKIRTRSYVVRRAEPLGNEYSVSAEASTAMMASTARSGARRGSIGMFWLVKPASTKVRVSKSEIYSQSAREIFEGGGVAAQRRLTGLVSAFQPRNELRTWAMSFWSLLTDCRMLCTADRATPEIPSASAF